MELARLTAVPATIGEPRLLSLASMLSELHTDAEQAHEAYENGTPRGPRIFLPGLSRALAGAMPQGLHMMHGVPGAGKTALALQMAAESGVPTMYVTAEMKPLELTKRVIARLSGQYLGRLKSGELSPATFDQYAQKALEKVPHLSIADATQAWPSPDWLRDAAKAVQRNHPYLLIVVDSLHSWAEGDPKSYATEYDTLNAGIASLRQLAGQLSCSVLAIAERNRISMRGGGLSAGAGTRKIEYGAESVIDLTHEEDAEFDESGERQITLKVVKNRNGDKCVSKLMFHGALQRFREL